MWNKLQQLNVHENNATLSLSNVHNQIALSLLVVALLGKSDFMLKTHLNFLSAPPSLSSIRTSNSIAYVILP